LHFAKSGAREENFAFPLNSELRPTPLWPSAAKNGAAASIEEMSAPPRERKTRASVTKKAATSKDTRV
jgi:hypothetical protein